MKMTTEQFLSHLGIEVGKPFNVKNWCEQDIYRVNAQYNLEWKTYDEPDTSFTMSSHSVSDLLDCEITPLPKYTLTEDEKAIVRNIDDKWKYIHRTNEEIMFISTCSADFVSKNNTWNYDGGHYFNRFPYAEKVFNFIGFGCSVSIDELRKCL